MKDITYDIIGCVYEVHKNLGPGLLESVYQSALAYELRQKGFRVKTEVPLDVRYKGVLLDCNLHMDILVNDSIILELKSVDELTPLHKKQLISYLKLMDLPIGLLLNFNVQQMKNGIVRVVNHFEEPHHESANKEG